MLSAPDLEQQYEELRAWAMGTVVRCPFGLGVLLKYGTPAWIQVMQTTPCSAVTPVTPNSPHVIPADPLVQILASMLWEARR